MIYISQCSPGLVCFQRDPGMEIPGCLNGERDTSFTDYCVLGTSVGPSVAPHLPAFPTKAPTRGTNKLVSYGGTPSSDFFPLQRCEGDCDVDADVSPSFLATYCFQLVLPSIFSLFIDVHAVRRGAQLLSKGTWYPCTGLLKRRERDEPH